MNVYDFTVKTNKGDDMSLSKFKGKVLLIVNTAIKCGLTPQYDGLEAIYEKLDGGAFEILDFPCNQFKEQAPGTDEDINNFCRLNYGTTFPRFAKIDVNGEEASPLFAYLKEQVKETGDKDSPAFLEKVSKLSDFHGENDIHWNFTKFIIDKEGNVVARYAPNVKPEDLKEKIESLM